VPSAKVAIAAEIKNLMVFPQLEIDGLLNVVLIEHH